MKKGTIGFLSFIFGGISGVALTYFYLKKKYENKIDEEIDSVKISLTKYYNEKYEIEPTETKKVEQEKPTISSGSSIEKNQTTEAEYVDYSAPYRSETVEKNMKAKEEAEKETIIHAPSVYLLDEQEFASSNLPTRTIYIYADDVVADEDGKIIDNPEILIGEDGIREAKESLQAYVRNENLECDFDVSFISRTYSSLSSSEKGF